MTESLVCPSCGSEYRAGITRCASCAVDLVSAGDVAARQAKRGGGREALAGVETTMVPQANLPSAKELERLIVDAGFACYTDAVEADQDVALGSSAAMTYGVVVRTSDVDAIRKQLRGGLEATLAKQGLAGLQTEAIDVDKGDVTCPACGHSGALVDGACGDCGLFLGAN